MSEKECLELLIDSEYPSFKFLNISSDFKQKAKEVYGDREPNSSTFFLKNNIEGDNLNIFEFGHWPFDCGNEFFKNVMTDEWVMFTLNNDFEYHDILQQCHERGQMEVVDLKDLYLEDEGGNLPTYDVPHLLRTEEQDEIIYTILDGYTQLKESKCNMAQCRVLRL